MTDALRPPASRLGPDGEPPTGGPVLRVVAGNPTPEEVAALTVTLAAVAAAARATPAAAGASGGGMRSEWSSKERALVPPLAPGPGAWRASARLR